MPVFDTAYDKSARDDARVAKSEAPADDEIDLGALGMGLRRKRETVAKSAGTSEARQITTEDDVFAEDDPVAQALVRERLTDFSKSDGIGMGQIDTAFRSVDSHYEQMIERRKAEAPASDAIIDSVTQRGDGRITVHKSANTSLKFGNGHPGKHGSGGDEYASVRLEDGTVEEFQLPADLANCSLADRERYIKTVARALYGTDATVNVVDHRAA
jgi:hypothetical protein